MCCMLMAAAAACEITANAMAVLVSCPAVFLFLVAVFLFLVATSLLPAAEHYAHNKGGAVQLDVQPGKRMDVRHVIKLCACAAMYDDMRMSVLTALCFVFVHMTGLPAKRVGSLLQRCAVPQLLPSDAAVPGHVVSLWALEDWQVSATACLVGVAIPAL